MKILISEQQVKKVLLELNDTKHMAERLVERCLHEKLSIALVRKIELGHGQTMEHIDKVGYYTFTEMEKNELRIGNLISQNGFNGYVYAIQSEEPRSDKRFDGKVLVTLFDNGLTTVSIDEIEPILLTEEWHNKFGGVKSGFNSFEYLLTRENNIDIKIVFSTT